MKKLLGVSIAAMLAVTPMIASAAGVAPTAATSVAADNEPFVGVTEDSTANIATTSYVQGAYNAAIGAVNARLKTAASGNAVIDQTVKTTIAAADSASDTALVTEKAIATALATAATNAAITGGAGVDVASGNVISVDLTQSGTGNDAYNASGLVMTGSGNAATLGINKGNGLEVISTSGADQGKLVVKGGDGITVGASGVAVDLPTTNPGLKIDANSKLDVKAGDGIAVGSGGVAVDLVTTNPTLKITNAKLEAKLADGLVAGTDGITIDANTSKALVVDGTSKKLEVKTDGTTIGFDGSGNLQVKSGVYDTSGSAAAVETKLTDGATGYDINAKSLQIQGSDVATTEGVTATISQSTVPVYKVWNSSAAADIGTVNIQSSYYRTDERTNGVDTAPANP